MTSTPIKYIVLLNFDVSKCYIIEKQNNLCKIEFENNKYSSKTVPQALLFDTPEQAIIHKFQETCTKLNEQKISLNEKINEIDDKIKQLHKSLEIEKIQSLYPELFV